MTTVCDDIEIMKSNNHNMPRLKDIRDTLRDQGYVLIRNEGFDVNKFSQLMTSLCQRLTYDPARENVTQQSQKVDSGTQAIGLHIENGTTPLPPDIIAFFSEVSATKGSQTTICDGYVIWENLSETLKEKFSQPMTISRYLPKNIWQKYVANAFGIKDPVTVTWDDLKRFIELIPGQSITPAENEGVQYHLQMNMIRNDNLSGKPAFANAVLGPSYNYEAPRYCFADGELISDQLRSELAELCEQHTHEVAWQDGDVLIIDNKRFMHGRREILVPLEQRKLCISMGLGLQNF
nr:TauD/TfdA family dioxygenase [Acinetobacter oleivorans]